MMNAGDPLAGVPAWHALPADAVLTALGADGEQGLGAAEVRARAARHGPNRLREQRPRPWWRIFLRQFADFMILVLLAAAFISGVLGDPVDTVAILFIVVLNAVIGAVQAHRADRALAALRALATPAARVVRDGAHARVASTDLVPGDLVLVEAGDIVPADLRLLEAVELAVDESALTGESGAIAKDAAAVLADATALGERCNLLYKGSLVSGGRARGVVVAIGMSTEIGRLAELLGQQKRVLTPCRNDWHVSVANWRWRCWPSAASCSSAACCRGSPRCSCS